LVPTSADWPVQVSSLPGAQKTE